MGNECKRCEHLHKLLTEQDKQIAEMKAHLRKATQTNYDLGELLGKSIFWQQSFAEKPQP